MKLIIVSLLLLVLCACGEKNNSFSSDDAPVKIPDSNGLSANSIDGVFDPSIYDRVAEMDPSVSIRQDFIRGGLLYDIWWAATDGSLADPPLETKITHPAWPTMVNSAITGVTSWRCATCHGWDYLGNTGVLADTNHEFYSGIKGVVSLLDPAAIVVAVPASIFAFIHSGQTTSGITHDFSLNLSDADIYALTRFISTVQSQENLTEENLSPNKVINNESKKTVANQISGFEQYHRATEIGGCDIECHGNNGELIQMGQSLESGLSKLAIENPWKFLHKIRFGDPGSLPNMPALDASDNVNVNFLAAVNVLAYSQAGLVRDYVRGGRLYDNFIVEAALPLPVVFNPLWDQRNPSFALPLTNEESWSCSSCHGFDYFGQVGFDNSLLYFSLRPWNESYVYQKISNGFNVKDWNSTENSVLAVHDYKTQISEKEIWNLVDFMMKGITDTYRYLSATTWAASGNVESGRSLYSEFIANSESCASCHGLDGVGGGVIDKPVIDIFSYAWDTPWQYLHKIRFGLPGGGMPALENMLKQSGEVFTLQDASDIQTYNQLRYDINSLP